MPTVYHIQSNFNRGQLDPRLIARVDFKGYYKGARKLENVLVQPQGSLRRRFGTKFIEDFDNRNNINSLSEVRLETFQFSGTFALLAFSHGRIDVYFEDEHRAEISTNYKSSEIQDLDLSQSFNNMIIVHKNHEPRRLEVKNFPTSWKFETIKFRNKPTFDFQQDYDNTTFTVDTTGNVRTSLNEIGAKVKISTSRSTFTSRNKGGLLFIGGGSIRITKVINSKKADGTVVQALLSESPFNQIKVEGNNVVLTEVIFSSVRGWPQSVSFYQSRLVFGGTKSLPTLISMSNINDFQNFDDSQTLDSSAITVLLNSDTVNEIQKIVSFTSLIVFTDTENFALQTLDSGAVTPSTVAFMAQDRSGINNIKPAILDNQVFYIERGGNIVRSYTFESGSLKYENVDISILSQNLIKDPRFMEVLRSQRFNDGNYIFLSNNDGTLAIFQTNQNQDIAAWTSASTDGKFGTMTDFDQNYYFIVERNGNFLLEKSDFELYMDSTKIYDKDNKVSEVTGLEHLEGKTVQILGDGFVQTERTVSNGRVTIDPPAKSIKVGLGYKSEIIPMPVAINLQTGNSLYLKQRIRRIFIDYFESLGIKVDGELIPFLKLDTGILDSVPTPKTGFSEITPLKGWDGRAEIKITQALPFPMTILSIAYEVEI